MNLNHIIYLLVLYVMIVKTLCQVIKLLSKATHLILEKNTDSRKKYMTGGYVNCNSYGGVKTFM